LTVEWKIQLATATRIGDAGSVGRVALSTDFVITGFANLLEAFLPTVLIFSSNSFRARAPDSPLAAVLRVALGGGSAIADLARPPLKFPAVINWVLFPKFLRGLETCNPQAATHCDQILI
jgi:hypothetical protein